MEHPSDLNICFIEFVEGRTLSPEVQNFQHKGTKVTIQSYARWSLQLCKAQFSSIGSLQPSATGKTIVGPLITLWEGLLQFPWYKGPYHSQADRYISSIDIILGRMREGDLPKLIRPRQGDPDVDAVLLYLMLLDTKKMVEQNPKLSEPATSTFVKHGDMSGDNILVDAEGELTGIIDWEWYVLFSYV